MLSSSFKSSNLLKKLELKITVGYHLGLVYVRKMKCCSVSGSIFEGGNLPLLFLPPPQPMGQSTGRSEEQVSESKERLPLSTAGTSNLACRALLLKWVYSFKRKRAGSLRTSLKLMTAKKGKGPRSYSFLTPWVQKNLLEHNGDSYSRKIK